MEQRIKGAQLDMIAASSSSKENVERVAA